MDNAYQTLLRQINVLSAKFNEMPMDAIFRAYDRAVDNNPWIQNRRVKTVNTLPAEYGKDAIGEAIKAPGANEKMLRGTHHALESTAYPMLKIRKVYTDLMTYRHYTAPAYLWEKQQAKSPEFRREMALLEKFSESLDVGANAHKITGQAIQEGKVFYFVRYEIDKSHNSVKYAFMQKLPSDWVKIVGYNNISGYTVSFNLFYFLTPGTNWRQFGDLFLPYLDDFDAVVEPPKGAVFASKWRVNMDKFNEKKNLAGNPEVYVQNGQWAYWVTLPIDRIWTFEIDDTNPNVVSPFTGLYLSMTSIAQYEQVQLELVQNPLIAVMTGEIPYRSDTAGGSKDDCYKLSQGGRILFETLWYNMLSQNNTSGIGLFLAPAENLKLHQLSEAPSATQISTNGYGYAIEKSGLSGLIPINDNPRAGTVNISVQMEARYCQRIYQQFERMMNYLYGEMNLKYSWKFHMFGDIYSDEKMRAEMHKSMSLGILPDLYLYNALMGRSMLDDISMSTAVESSGILDMRLPLVTSYTAKNGGPLPPTADEGGRPTIDIGDVTSEGTEDLKDAD